MYSCGDSGAGGVGMNTRRATLDQSDRAGVDTDTAQQRTRSPRRTLVMMSGMCFLARQYDRST